MEIKYEAVFGPQELFDCASDDAVLAIKDTTSGRIHIFTNDGWIKSGLKHERHIGTSDKQIAMRRIIKAPVWTVADQQAGRLPEVGCRIYVPMMLEEQNVIYSSEKIIVSISDNEGAVTRTEVGSIDRIKPIESPEEKAARLRKEWCVAASKQLKNLEYNSTLTSIYDALLSGDLPVPVKE